MKAFSFRLEQVLRWRDMQVGLQKARVAGAAGHVAQLRTALELRKAEAAEGAAQIIREPTGAVLASYGAFVEKARIGIERIEEQVAAAERNLAAETDRLMEANRRLRLLQDLKKKGHGHWQKELDRELAAFADEAFLGRVESRSGRTRRQLSLEPMDRTTTLRNLGGTI